MYKRADIEAQFYPEQNALQLYYYNSFTKQPNSSAHFKHNVVRTDTIDVGGWYVINIWQDTTRVLTNVNNDIYLRDYNEGDQHQIFYATRDAENRLGFVCVGTNKRMGRNRYENVKCEDPPSEQGSWQAFYIEDEYDGSRKMSMTIYDNLTPMAYASDSGGQYLTLSSDGNLRFGFTRVGPPS
ncbi:hypothetical protein CC2G_001959 [Coprinopsis cinerea AmutBmut pab1-1]|nr:hypothetical protein CC2G_001959 [Coprinopsis cinerea AmutBmut pab1-1]